MSDVSNHSAGRGPAVAALGRRADDGGPESAPAVAPRRRQRRLLGGRHYQIKVRCSGEEIRRVMDLADLAGVSAPKLLLDSVLRRGGLDAAQRQARLVSFLAARRSLAGVATNLNQAARWANTEHQLPPGFEELVEQVRRSLSSLDAAIKEVSG